MGNKAMKRRDTKKQQHIFTRATFCALCLLAALNGCEAVPTAGPRPPSFDQARWQYVAPTTDENGEPTLPFVLIDVDHKIIQALASAEDTTYLTGALTDNSPVSAVLLGAGDTLRITIFEAGPGGLFVQSGGTGTGGNYITLPDQEINQNGTITIPYADKNGDGGLVKVAGHTTSEVQSDIQQRLMNKAIEPQIIVTLVKHASNLYTVMGDVAAPGRFSLNQGGLRILDALVIAGGAKSYDYNTLITLQRGSASNTIRMSTLLTQPENNIYVQPNDLLSVKKDERYYNVLGATKNNTRIAFEAENVTVADAIAKAGGLNGDLAEPGMVVVFRREEAKALEGMDIKLDGNHSDEPIPTVYRLDFTEPSGMFLAQKMQLRNNDVLYIAAHPFTDVNKLFSVFRDVLLLRLITQ